MSEPTAEQYPICAGCECPDGQCECVECTEYQGPVARLRDLPRDERRAILEHAANDAAEAGMYAEPAAESFAEQFGGKGEVQIRASMAATSLAVEIAESIEKADGSWVYEGDDLPGQIAPHLLPVMTQLESRNESRKTYPFADFINPVEFQPVKMTMQQAIGRIVDGLVLEWVEHSDDFHRVENNRMGWFTVRPVTDVLDVGVVGQVYWTFLAHEGNGTTERPRRAGGVCDSVDLAKSMCLKLYQDRFRAEIEKAVAS